MCKPRMPKQGSRQAVSEVYRTLLNKDSSKTQWNAKKDTINIDADCDHDSESSRTGKV